MEIVARSALTISAFTAAAVGIVQAIRQDLPALAVLFGLLAAVLLWMEITARRGRRSIRVRPDLARWLDETSAVTGEAPDELADRCISSYRARLHAHAPD